MTNTKQPFTYPTKLTCKEENIDLEVQAGLKQLQKTQLVQSKRT